jgi:hypothetical protein
VNKIAYELAAAALDKAVPETYTFLDHDKLNRYTEQLTVLIIEECCSIIIEQKTEPSLFDKEVAVDLLREHFGVEK